MPITKATASSVAPAAKGDLVVGSATNDAAVLGVGTNDQVLTADSSTATGLKWATASSGGMTLINSGGTSLTGASVTISSIPSTYKSLMLQVVNFKPASDTHLACRFNSDTGTNYNQREASATNVNINDDRLLLSYVQDSVTANGFINWTFYDYTNTSSWRIGTGHCVVNNGTTATNGDFAFFLGVYKNTGTAINSITLLTYGGANFTSGTAYLYGVS